MDAYEADRPLPVTPGVFDNLRVSTESLALIRKVGRALVSDRGYRDDAPLLAYRIVHKALRDAGFKQQHWRVLIGDDPLPDTVDMPLPVGPGLFEVPPGAVKPPVTVDDDEDDDEDGGCDCADCYDQHCDGSCPRCSDHGCNQCWGPGSDAYCDDHDCRDHYPDGCPPDDLSECCGQCSECGKHDSGHDRPEVCDRDHCHECDHYCDTD